MLEAVMDFEVIAEEAEDGRAAVALAQRKRPDVVLMDVSMPVLNGAGATRQIQQTVPSAKVLALSAYSDEEYVEEMMNAGAAGYLAKDTAPLDLIPAIRAVHAGGQKSDRSHVVL